MQGVSATEALARACQIAAGRAVQWWEPPPINELIGVFADSPPIASYGESLTMERVLSQFVNALGTLVHRHFHQHFPDASCVFEAPALQCQCDGAGYLIVEGSVAGWLCVFTDLFFASHATAAQQARRLLESNVTRRLPTKELSRGTHTTPRTLERRFREEIGDSIAEYRAYVRLNAALVLLREERTTSVESVAVRCGWKTKKGLYEACVRYSGFAPSHVRTLAQPEFTAMMQRFIARHSAQTCWCVRSFGTYV
jgi:AraC-like DNA-binding protein